jgi:hypothetical protein
MTKPTRQLGGKRRDGWLFHPPSLFPPHLAFSQRVFDINNFGSRLVKQYVTEPVYSQKLRLLSTSREPKFLIYVEYPLGEGEMWREQLEWDLEDETTQTPLAFATKIARVFWLYV